MEARDVGCSGGRVGKGIVLGGLDRGDFEDVAGDLIEKASPSVGAELLLVSTGRTDGLDSDSSIDELVPETGADALAESAGGGEAESGGENTAPSERRASSSVLDLDDIECSDGIRAGGGCAMVL